MQEFAYIMGSEVSFAFNEQYLVIKDTEGVSRIRFQLDGGLLKYQVYENGDWQ